MFQERKPQTRTGSALSILELIFHNTVRQVRKSHASAVFAILLSILQTVILVLSFYLLFVVLGMRGSAIRGDFLLYIMSGIFLFLTHTKTVGAVYGSEGPASAMMNHAPMTTAVTITSAALSTLYVQSLSLFCVLYVYHVGWGPIHIHYWPGAYAMVLLAWVSGIGVGLCFLALKPWIPDIAGNLQMIYNRASMIASGKMFVANALPGYMVAWFDWNPLFHSIDQARGYVFINYFPHNSNITYPLTVSAVLITIGLMGEFYTRQNASISWSARR
ncbi:Polysialic acid transport protein KpsM [Rhodobacteraceae bacterium THAF1]|uniref:ABC transporter permease n=1 Tax=Palleronia sp. THAF1 TaxID=2587842 RepID=UPI000F3E9D56|nr:ABC transporter permease [Palleronia sp. THAF1]QFU07102.1 Polysialic acid transport protein KpsM [Palleronia sp. THAF1]VDC16745.1 Polysialic acid transport protein KpsM [Rhodobacteraceae bacterium THAF1]